MIASRILSGLIGFALAVTLLPAQQTSAGEHEKASVAACASALGKGAWKDRALSPDCRAKALIHAMTLDDKLGSFAYYGSKKIWDRYGVPELRPQDGPNGMAKGPFPGPPMPIAVGVTAFPNEIVLGASWNRDLAAEYGKALGEEWRGKGSSEIIAPTLNLMRTWHWGRSGETFGEDPYLTGAMAVPEVKALQQQKVSAMIKHFTANNQDDERVGHFPEFRNVNETISQRTLEEVYYGAFRMVVKEAEPGAVMCSYNQINGVPSCNNAAVQNKLREWGFNGYIEPDAVFALHDSLAAIDAGVDDAGTPEKLKELLDKKQIDEAVLDRMIYHKLLTVFRLGIFDQPSTGKETDRATTAAHVDLARRMIAEGSVLLKNKDRLLPLQAAKQKIVVIGAGAGPQALTGEEGPLVFVEKLSVPAEAIKARAGASAEVRFYPLGAGIRPLPAISADVLTPLTGSGHGLTASFYKSGDLSGEPVAKRVDAKVDFFGLPAKELGEQIPSFSVPTMSWSGSWEGSLTPPATGEYVFSLTGAGTARLLLDGKETVLLNKVNFNASAFGTAHLEAGKPVALRLEHSNDYAVLGSSLQLGWSLPDPDKYEEALKAASEADAVVVFAGEQLGEGMDKRHLSLPGDQDALIEAVAARNKHTVVVLTTSTPVAMPWLNKVGAVLEAWYPGQEMGAGVASLLFGDADPGGRLPVTFPVDESEGPATSPASYPGVLGEAHYDEGILIGYRWYDAKQQQPLFPFGFGLSYTQYSLSGYSAKLTGTDVVVELTVRNTGIRMGIDVVEVYVKAPAQADEPPALLRGFEKVNLNAGESRKVTLRIPVESLKVWSETEKGWKLIPGRYVIKTGESSRNLPLSAAVEIEN